jgi:hypothetical protein
VAKTVSSLFIHICPLSVDDIHHIVRGHLSYKLSLGGNSQEHSSIVDIFYQESGKGKETDYSLEPPERSTTLCHLNFSPLRPMSDFPFTEP